MNNRGFTLIEIIIAIAILGVIATMALPRYFDIRDRAEESALNGTLASIRAGIAIYHGKQLASNATPVWPNELDSQPVGLCTDCFSNVLQDPLNDDRWEKFGSWYSYTLGDGTMLSFKYYNTDGSFLPFSP